MTTREVTVTTSLAIEQVQAALRLAEKAEENPDWRLAVVDNGLQAMVFTHEVGDLEIEHVFRHAKDYRKVVAP